MIVLAIVVIAFVASVQDSESLSPVVLSAGASPEVTSEALASTPSFPFYDGFESGSLSADWTVYTTNQGQVQVSDSYPCAGSYSLLLDDSQSDSTYSYAAAILTIDLAGQSGVLLDFWWHKFLDEYHADDGVFISDDGATWYRVLFFSATPTAWRHQVIDLDAATAAAGMSCSSRSIRGPAFWSSDLT